MLSAYVLRSGLTRLVGNASAVHPTVIFSKPNTYNVSLRQLSNQTRGTFTRRAARTRSLKEIAMAPAGEGGTIQRISTFRKPKKYFELFPVVAFSLGKGLVLGASGLGLGALCFYGLGFSSQPGAIDRAV